MKETIAEYVYTTVAGAYSFTKVTPYLLQYKTAEGQALVAASTFLVLVPNATLFLAAEVLAATDYRYQVRYGLVKVPDTAAMVTITYDFQDDGPPKVTAEVNQTSGPTLALTWVTLPVDDVAFNGIATIDFGSLNTTVQIPTTDFELQVGPNTDPTNWTRRVVLDWSDAHAGRASIGRFSAGGLTGSAVLVQFPEGTTTIDPSIAGTSTTTAATDYSIQRKAFAYGGYYFAFWNDGGAIAYASSRDGSAWSSKMTTTSGAVSYGFDVDQRDGTVVVGYVPSAFTSLKVLKGTITGSFITWNSAAQVDTWPTPETGPPTVAIGTDGYFWIAVPHRDVVFNQVFFFVYRSVDPWSTSFASSLTNSLPGVPSDSVARVLALPNGGAYAIVLTKGYSNFGTYRYGAGGWGPVIDHTVFSLPLNDDRGSVMSAVGLPDGRVRIAYRRSNGELHTLRFELDDISSYEATLETRSSYYPAVSLDANGESHVFYRYVDASSRYWIYYVRQRPALQSGSEPWSTPEAPFSSTTAWRNSLSAIPLSIDRAGVLFTQGDTPYSVRFGSVPTPMDFGSQTGEPWNRQGLSPYQGYLRQLSEFVSPGSGLLTVKQTDLSLPGRGLNLEISRVFLTPRSFWTGTQTPAASLFEDYPAANLGKGWRLDFPWISDQYLHIWNGQMYVIRWQGLVFENHDGEHFVLTRSCIPSCYSSYTLYTRSGIQYVFDSARKLTTIKDLFGNQITFSYSGSQLSGITDTVGRTVSFAYNANGTLRSITSGPLTVTYGYQNVAGLTLLRYVRDALGRETRFEHTDIRNAYLLTSVRYPTGAKSGYSWSNPAIPAGPDLQAYYVTLQDTLNLAGQSIRSNQYTYTVVNGRVSYAKVTAFDAGIAKGSTSQWFDPLARRSTTVRQDAAGTRLSKEVAWFGGAGAVGQVDVYPGASTSPSHSLLTAYDEWGNVIYTRDGIGHERFASYVNTRFQGGFVAPGRLTRTAGGLLFSDDFEDRDLSDWTLDTTAGTPILDYQTFETFPPALTIAHNGAASGVSAATHTFAAQSASFVVEVTVRAAETNKHHYVLLRAGSSIRVYVSLRDNGQISWFSGTAWNDFLAYQANQWYRIAYVVYPSTATYDIWVNGRLLKAGAAMTGTGLVDRINLQASCSGCGAATIVADLVNVYTSLSVTFTGLQAGQVVRFYDALGRLARAGQVASGGTTLTLSFNPGSLPYGTVNVYATDGTLDLSSPTHEFWGGDTWSYTASWKSFPVRTRSGFLRASYVYLDESTNTPGGTYVGAEDGWDWGAYDFPILGTQSHRSKALTGIHQHYFQDALQLTIGAGNYLIQYVYIPENQYPSEIMLQFRDAGNSWEHRAYWGANLIPWGADNTNARRFRGTLPGPSGQWLMLIVKADDVGMGAVNLEGLNYTLFGGRTTWDFSAKGDSETGEIRISGLQSNWKAELYNPKGDLASSGTVPAGGNTAAIPVGGFVAFPFEGYFVIRDAGNVAQYRSPVMSFWGGDVYSYNATNFYPNVGVGPTVLDVGPVVHDRLAGTLEYQTGRGAPTPVPQSTFARYTGQGLPDRAKVNDSGVWRETSYTNDGTYGTLTSVKDAGQNTVSFTHSPAYGRAYVSGASDAVGSLGRYAYDPRTGWVLSSRDGRGYPTRYAYDALGRSTAESRFDLPALAERLYLDMEWMTEDATPKAEDLSGQANHGTFTGTAVVSSPAGIARDFNGTSDRIVVADSATLDVGSEWSASAWIKPDTIAGVHRILEKGKLGVSQWEYGVFQNSADVSFRVWQPGGADHAAVTATGVLAVGQWTHVAGTYKLGIAIRIYVDGVERASSTTFTGSTAAGSETVKIGARESTSSFTEFFDGSIDEVRIINQFLGASEVSNLSQNSFRLLTSSSAAYDDVGNVLTLYEPTTRPRAVHLDMEKTLNGLLEDLAGRGSHGTIAGATCTSGVAGKVGAACSFAGSTQRVTMPTSAVLNLTSSVAIAAWVYPTTTAQAAGAGIVAKGTGGGEAYAVDVTGGKFRVFFWKGGSSYIAQGTTTFAANTWYFLTAVYDGPGRTLKLYVNGNLEATTSSVPSTLSMNAHEVSIGNRESTASSGYDLGFQGRIDEVQFFARPLTASNITAIYAGTEKGSYAKTYFDSLGRGTMAVRRDFFNALTSWESTAYNWRDQAVSHTVARNASGIFTTTAAYDFLGRPTTITYPEFPSNPTTFAYDDVNRIRTALAENGRKIAYLFDPGGRTTAVREYYSPVSYYTTSYAYDEVGNLLSVTNPLNQVTSHQYDNRNRLTRTTYPDTTKYELYTYDAVGNLKTRRDRAGQLTTYSNDSRYRMTGIDYSATAPNPDVLYAYDMNDNPTSVTTAVSPATTVSYTYDGLDRVLTESTLVGGRSYPVDYAFDMAGRVTRMTYPHNADNSRSWVDYVYDAIGRTASVKDASTTFATFAYHADDLMKNTTLGNGVLKDYQYNGRGWPTRIRATNTPGGQTTYLDLSYTYDASGNVLSMGTSSFTYDALDRLKTAAGGFGSHAYVYDAVGNRKAIDYGGGTTRSPPYPLDYGSVYNGVAHTWTTNPATGQAWTVADVNALSAGIELDATNWIARVTQVFMVVRINGVDVTLRPNGPGAASQWTKSGTGGANWDRVDEASSDGDATYVSSSIAGTTDLYGFQDLGQTGTISYVTISAMGRVPTCAEPPCWADLRLVLGAPSASYTYADGPTGMNTLTSMVDRLGVTTTFAYDANGNLDTKTGGWDYDWNAEHLMTVAKLSAVPQQSYVYDGLGRRVNVTGLSSTWTASIFSGMDPIFEKDQSGAITKYVFANGMRIAKITPSGAVQYYLGDHLGSTRKVLDASRNTVFSTDYEPFGKPVAPTGAEAYKFTMEKHDDPTGLVYLRARQYDPEIGRFVSADSVLGRLGSPQTLNRYSYVVNNPLRYVDPTGKACEGFNPFTWGECAGDAAGAIGNWWDQLDPNWKTAIIFAALTVAVIATAGLAAPLVGVAAGGIISTMVTGALVAGTVSAGLYVGTSLATGQEVTLSGFSASFATGAFFGAVGSVAGMAGGSLAKALGQTATSLLAKSTTGAIIMGTSVGVDLIRGERDSSTIGFNALISLGVAKGVGKLFTSRGMTTFNQAQYFAPRTLGAFGHAIFDPGNAGLNAKALLHGTMAKGIVIGFGKMFWDWYDQS